ncbi:hypothetical protein QWZ13_03295 [Reinekea marina]|nr:hypothetical protein [Reinekea marina]MDN3647937.1 hypothetical protein [Reinekea marina]
MDGPFYVQQPFINPFTLVYFSRSIEGDVKHTNTKKGAEWHPGVVLL